MQENPLIKIDAKQLHELFEKVIERVYDRGYEDGKDRSPRDLSKVKLNYVRLLTLEFNLRKKNSAARAKPPPTPKYRPPNRRGR